MGKFNFPGLFIHFIHWKIIDITEAVSILLADVKALAQLIAD